MRTFSNPIAAALLLAAAAPGARAALIPVAAGYSSFAQIRDTNNNVIVEDGTGGTLLAGGPSSGTISGTRSDNGVTTQHAGSANHTVAIGPGGISGSGSANSRTTYIGGANEYISQQTVSGFGSTIDFTVNATQQYVATLTGAVTAYHRAYEPDGPAGSFFSVFRLSGNNSPGYLFDNSVLNVPTLTNVPFTQTVTLTPGVAYRLEFSTASTGNTIRYTIPEAGPGEYSETGYTQAFSLTAVPEPGVLPALMGLGAAGMSRARRRRG
jgi:hypothetical protein